LISSRHHRDGDLGFPYTKYNSIRSALAELLGLSSRAPAISGLPAFQSIFSYALSIINGDVVPIPKSASKLLLGSGLFGFVGLRRKFRKN
jgi:hypothetical protein